MPTDESDYFLVIISEDKHFDASQGSFVEIIIEVPKKPRPKGGATLKSPGSTRCHADDRARYRHKQLERETCGRAARQTQRIAFARQAGGQGWQFDCVDSARTVRIGKL